MFNVSEIIQTIKQLIEVRLTLIKEEINDAISAVFTRIVLLLLMAVTSLMFLFFASISLALYISEQLYSPFMGFLYVSLIYVLIFILIYFIKEAKGVTTPTQKFLKKFIFGRKVDDEEK